MTFAARGLVLLSLCLLRATGEQETTYSKGDVVRVFATHVGPVANPSETYPFYVLPYCPPADGDLEAPASAQSLGETFSGDRKANTPYEFAFGEDRTDVIVCERELTEEDVVRFVGAARGRGAALCAARGARRAVYVRQ